MSTPADEDVIHRVQRLAVAELHSRHRDLRQRRSATRHRRHERFGQRHGEGHQDAVDALRVRVEGQDGLAGKVLGDVHHEPIRAEGDDEVGGAKDEVGQERTLDELVAHAPGDGRSQAVEPTLVRVVGVLVLRERPAAVLDVEARLVAGVEPGHQLLKRRLSRHHDELPEVRHLCPASLSWREASRELPRRPRHWC